MTDFREGRPREGHAAPPLTRAHMPGGFDISLDRYTGGRTVRVPEEYGPRQDMPGFDPAYRNIVDYIVRITHRIWEGGESHRGEREVEYIAECYAPDSRVFDDFGLQHGNAKIVRDTHHTTSAYPDIELDAEEVIWAGDAETGFHTSHRCAIRGTNEGPSNWGAATGHEIDVLVIANCVARGNDIFLEHVLYNTSAMLVQLGLDPMREAERLVADPPAGWPRDEVTWQALRREGAPERPLSKSEPVQGFDPDAFAREVHGRLWNRGDVSVFDTHYAPDVPFEGTTGRTFEGVESYRGYIETLRECFGDLRLTVDETYWMGNDREGWLVATRWSADAVHAGGVLYGTGTGAPLQIWGITQSEVREGRVVAEWQLFNEFDVMMQVAAARRRA